MDDLLKFFIEEARELVQNAGQSLLILEKNPEEPDALTEVFRYVHTLKGSGGVLELHALVKVVHVAEELLELAKEGDTRLDASCIDALLEAMDQISAWVDALDTQGSFPDDADSVAETLAGELGALLEAHKGSQESTDIQVDEQPEVEDEPLAVEETSTEAEWGEGVNWGVFDDPVDDLPTPTWLGQLDEEARRKAFQLSLEGETLWVVDYTPDEGCFYQGDDPLLNLRQAPGLLGLALVEPFSNAAPEEVDVYQCQLHLGP